MLMSFRQEKGKEDDSGLLFQVFDWREHAVNWAGQLCAETWPPSYTIWFVLGAFQNSLLSSFRNLF